MPLLEKMEAFGRCLRDGSFHQIQLHPPASTSRRPPKWSQLRTQTREDHRRCFLELEENPSEHLRAVYGFWPANPSRVEWDETSHASVQVWKRTFILSCLLPDPRMAAYRLHHHANLRIFTPTSRDAASVRERLCRRKILALHHLIWTRILHDRYYIQSRLSIRCNHNMK